jgi:glycosyltransferase involved in cell wall biosynthesis
MDNNLISIIMPVHNQAGHIERIIERYINKLKKLPLPYEMILVVNGCTDDSLDLSNKLKERYENVKVINIEKSGWGRAVIAGLKSSEGGLLCFTNSARTSDGDLLQSLLYATANADVVVKANRKIRDSWVRSAGSILYNIECRTLFDLSCWDINGTPKIFPRRFERLFSLTENGNLLDLEFNIICKEEGYPMIEIPIFSSYRHSGSSTTGLRSAFKMFWKAFLISRERNQK